MCVHIRIYLEEGKAQASRGKLFSSYKVFFKLFFIVLNYIGSLIKISLDHFLFELFGGYLKSNA
jgi:hypothetical protein